MMSESVSMVRRSWLCGVALAATSALAACGSGDGDSSELPQISGGASSTGSDTPDGSSGTTGGDTSVEETTTGSASESSGEPILGCGNGVVEDDEQCDDANESLCDGCEACESRMFLSLDGGAGHHVQIADVADAPLTLTGTPFTVEAWIRLNKVEDRVQIVRAGENSGWRLGLSTSSVRGSIFGVAPEEHVANAVVSFGWHHVAWTYDESTSNLWVDGVMWSSMDMTIVVEEAEEPLRLGVIADGMGQVTGNVSSDIDELRISDSERYIGEFVPARRHEPDANTLLLLHFDEGASSRDVSDYGHTMAESGAIWLPDDGYGSCG
jgi:hypothetical protein